MHTLPVPTNKYVCVNYLIGQRSLIGQMLHDATTLTLDQ
jgi:hypothetical protein